MGIPARSNLLLRRLSFLFILIAAGCSHIREGLVSEEADPKVAKLTLKPGFHVQHLYSPSENQQGSWVAMTFDNKGRLITSDQFGSLYRLELPPTGSDEGDGVKVEELVMQSSDVTPGDTSKPGADIGYAQGLLWAFNSLYVMVNRDGDWDGNEDVARPSGLYRLQDTDQDDQFDKITLLKSLEGSGEHGPHSIILSHDKKSLYVIAGNRTDLPVMDSYRLPPIWQQDNMYPLINYPSGGGEVNRKAPAGWIAKVDSTGAVWELVGAGLRNAYDIASNEDGDLFTYESDKEFDLGMPWYKPTRIYHVTSGSEFGWRTGNNIWPSTNADNLPPIINIGMGSPTALISGAKARFPEKYRRALFGFDWSFGIVYAIHLEPSGSTYSATAEEFISGSPLPLTAGSIGPDGALYFLTGGRRLDSDLYRVYHKDHNEAGTELTPDKSGEAERLHAIRKRLEQYHSEPNELALREAWQYLKHEDRFIRYAARIAIEHQPVSQWQAKGLYESDPRTLIHAMIALARHGDPSVKNRMLDALLSIDFKQLPESHQLELVRAVELVLLRMGKTGPDQRARLMAYFDPHYPAKSHDLNRALSKLLIYLDDPLVVQKTLALMDLPPDSQMIDGSESTEHMHRNPQYGLAIAQMQKNAPPAHQVYFAIALSASKKGWTPQMREKYFKWFAKAFSYQAGRNYIGYVNRARQNALANVPKELYDPYDSISGREMVNHSGVELANVVKPKGPGRNWNVPEALGVVEDNLVNRDFGNGKAMFAATLCSSCHGMNGEGGSVGPDLSQLGNRFSAEDILESIIDPGKVISDQYASTLFYLKDGGSVLGRLINEDGDKYYVSQNPFMPEMLVEISKDDVSKRIYSDLSIMPPGLINRLNEEELKNLMAYLISGGNENHESFKSKAK